MSKHYFPSKPQSNLVEPTRSEVAAANMPAPPMFFRITLKAPAMLARPANEGGVTPISILNINISFDEFSRLGGCNVEHAGHRYFIPREAIAVMEYRDPAD